MTRRLLMILLVLASCELADWASSGDAVANDNSNPRIVKARDPKLDREFEYLVYDLGQGVELKLVKVWAKGRTFSIGSSEQARKFLSASC